MSVFRTIEVSDPRFEIDGLRFVTVKSPALRARADVVLFAPPETKGRKEVPLVLLLHGVYGSHWSWALKGGAHRTVRRLIRAGQIPPIALAMPSDGLWGDGSAYLPHASHDFERWIVDDVPAAAWESLSCLSEESPLFIAGLSMGGFGALRLAAKYPSRFRAASGHSSVTHLDQLKKVVEEDLGGASISAADRSVLDTVLLQRGTFPAIRFDCGTEDELIEPNRELHRQLETRGIPHRFEEFAGGHDWPYWERHFEDTLLFFAETLNVAKRQDREI